IGSKEARSSDGLNAEVIFKAYSPAINTARDGVVYDFERTSLSARVERFCDYYSAELDRYKRAKKPVDTDQFVRYDHVKCSYMLKRKLERGVYAEFGVGRIRTAIYRPFSKRHLYFEAVLLDARGIQTYAFPARAAELENRLIVISDIGYRAFSV